MGSDLNDAMLRHVQTGELRRQNQSLHAELTTLRTLLKELEWSGTVHNSDSPACPICGEEPDMHDAECRLMAALGTEARDGN